MIAKKAADQEFKRKVLLNERGNQERVNTKPFTNSSTV